MRRELGLRTRAFFGFACTCVSGRTSPAGFAWGSLSPSPPNTAFLAMPTPEHPHRASELRHPGRPGPPSTSSHLPRQGGRISGGRRASGGLLGTSSLPPSQPHPCLHRPPDLPVGHPCAEGLGGDQVPASSPPQPRAAAAPTPAPRGGMGAWEATRPSGVFRDQTLETLPQGHPRWPHRPCPTLILHRTGERGGHSHRTGEVGGHSSCTGEQEVCRSRQHSGHGNRPHPQADLSTSTGECAHAQV